MMESVKHKMSRFIRWCFLHLFREACRLLLGKSIGFFWDLAMLLSLTSSFLAEERVSTVLELTETREGGELIIFYL